MLVVVVQDVGHEGGVVGQPLAHAQGDGLTGEQAVAPRRRVHGDGDAHRQHGHGQHPQEIHDWSTGDPGREAEPRGSFTGRGDFSRPRQLTDGAVWQRNPTRLKPAASIAVWVGDSSQ